MGFPLGDWIDGHSGVRHNLGVSGMVGELRSVRRALRRPPPADADELRSELARIHGVDARRVFLTHGATEGNALAQSYLAFLVRKKEGRAPRHRMTSPEYPPIRDVADLVGFRAAEGSDPPDVVILSNPNNPTGLLRAPDELATMVDGARRVLVDEVFREFSGRPSLTRRTDLPGLWVVASFTKAYGADPQRLGFVIPSEEDAPGFDRHHGLLLDRVPPPSISAGRALLDARREILSEARGILRENLRALRRRVPQVPRLDAPLWFDRGPARVDGDRLADAAVQHDVLVCPGSYFGDASGVRVCLTRRSFPRDLEAYLAVRERFLGRAD